MNSPRFRSAFKAVPAVCASLALLAVACFFATFLLPIFRRPFPFTARELAQASVAWVVIMVAGRSVVNRGWRETFSVRTALAFPADALDLAGDVRISLLRRLSLPPPEPRQTR